MINVGFIVENNMGHGTYALALKNQLLQNPEIVPHWINLIQPRYFAHNWTVDSAIQTQIELRRKQRLKLDVLFFHTQTPAILASNWMKKIPSIVSLDATPRQYDSLGYHYNHKTRSKMVEQVKWRIHKRCFSLAKALVTWSEWAKNGLISDYEVATSKVNVIYPPIPALDWKTSDSEKSKKCQTEPIKILFVGNDFIRKGGNLLVKAFCHLLLSHPDSELHIVSNHPFSSSKPNIFIHTSLNQQDRKLQNLYQECDIFCLPTLSDTFGLAVAEAAICKKPIVTTNMAAMSELVCDQVTGILISPNCVNELQASLDRLMRDKALRERMGRLAYQHACRLFSVKRSSEKLIGLLESVL